MCGTVKCRPTLAYRVHFDGNNISAELITRYYSNEKLVQGCFNVRTTSATLASINQHLVSVPFWLGKLTWELALNEAMGMKRI